ncbi:MAG: AzlD domain-containing protein [Oscillospiraceae bacterium]
MNHSIVIYVAVMAVVTYLIRAIPLAAFRRKINSRFIRSFLYYVPYAVLGAMTIPAIFYSTGDLISSLVGTITALILAYFNRSLIVVAVSASLAAYLTELAVAIFR